MIWVCLFSEEVTKYRHVFLLTIIKEIQTGPSTESTAYVTFGSKEYKRYMHIYPICDIHVPVIDY